jgi:hypothetical protein
LIDRGREAIGFAPLEASLNSDAMCTYYMYYNMSRTARGAGEKKNPRHRAEIRCEVVGTSRSRHTTTMSLIENRENGRDLVLCAEGTERLVACESRTVCSFVSYPRPYYAAPLPRQQAVLFSLRVKHNQRSWLSYD